MADFVEEEAGEEPQEEPQEGGEAAGSDDDNAGLPSDEEEASGSGSDSDSSAEGSDDEDEFENDGFIVDEAEDEEEEGGGGEGKEEGSDVEGAEEAKKRRKKKRRRTELVLDEEDYELLEDNTGIRRQRPQQQHRRIKKARDAEPAAGGGATDAARALQEELFGLEDDELEDAEEEETGAAAARGGGGGARGADRAGGPGRGPSRDEVPLPEPDDQFDDDEDDWLVHEDEEEEGGGGGAKAQRQRRRRAAMEGMPDIDPDALAEADELFGNVEDLLEMYEDRRRDRRDEGAEEEPEEEYLEEEGDEEEAEARRLAREERQRGAAARRMQQQIDPESMARHFLLPRDEQIRETDVPEREQLHRGPDPQSLDLAACAAWVWDRLAGRRRNVEATAVLEDGVREVEGPPPHWYGSSRWHPRDLAGGVEDLGSHRALYRGRPHSDDCYDWRHNDVAQAELRGAIQAVLRLLYEKHMEVPFIARYRKEHCGELLAVGGEDKPRPLKDDQASQHFPPGTIRAGGRTIRRYEVLYAVQALAQRWKAMQIRREARQRAYEKALGETMHSGEQAAIEACLEVLMEAETMEELDDAEAKFRLITQQAAAGAEEELSQLTLGGAAGSRRPLKSTPYALCLRAGLGGWVSGLGLSAAQLAENVEATYQKHQAQDLQVTPLEHSASFVAAAGGFSTPEGVLKGGCHVAATQIAAEPLVRQEVRKQYEEHACLWTKPTSAGDAALDPFHPLGASKRLVGRPIRHFEGTDLFLRILQAEKEGLVTVRFGLKSEHDTLDGAKSQEDVLNSLADAYLSGGLSEAAVEWDKVRKSVLHEALTAHLLPALEREARARLAADARATVLEAASGRLWAYASRAPLSVRLVDDDEEEPDRRVMAVCYGTGSPATTFVMLDPAGNLIDFLHCPQFSGAIPKRKALPGLVYNMYEDPKKGTDATRIRQFIETHKPHAIVVGASSPEATTLESDLRDIKESILLDNPRFMIELGTGDLQVLMADESVPAVWENSVAAQEEMLAHAPLPIVRRAVALGRQALDPLALLSSLCGRGQEVLALTLHQLQAQIPEDDRLMMVERVLCTAASQVGVDLNGVAASSWLAAPLQFVPGLGPRKAAALLHGVQRAGGFVESRAQVWRELGVLGNRVFKNAAGSLRIRASTKSTANLDMDPLDDSRIHPESYDFAIQMAKSAVQGEGGEEEAEVAVENAFAKPNEVEVLDLLYYDQHLQQELASKAAADGGAADPLDAPRSRLATLVDIQMEFAGPFGELRKPLEPLKPEEVFWLCSGETQETLKQGRRVEARIRNIGDNEIRCVLPDLNGIEATVDKSEVSVSLNREMAPRQGEWSLREANLPLEQNGTLQARVLEIFPDQFIVRLSSRSDRMPDDMWEAKYLIWNPGERKGVEGYQMPSKQDLKEAAEARRKVAAPKFKARPIQHPLFKNISLPDAAAELTVDDVPVGSCIIRPSARSAQFLNVTWKMPESIWHVDIEEKGKTAGSLKLGNELVIEFVPGGKKESYEDLDEVAARYVEPIQQLLGALVKHRKWKKKAWDEAKEDLLQEKQSSQGRAVYCLCYEPSRPGALVLGYILHRTPKREYFMLTPDGVYFRKKEHSSLDRMLHFWQKNPHLPSAVPSLPPQELPPPPQQVPPTMATGRGGPPPPGSFYQEQQQALPPLPPQAQQQLPPPPPPAMAFPGGPGGDYGGLPGGGYGGPPSGGYGGPQGGGFGGPPVGGPMGGPPPGGYGGPPSGGWQPPGPQGAPPPGQGFMQGGPPPRPGFVAQQQAAVMQAQNVAAQFQAQRQAQMQQQQQQQWPQEPYRGPPSGPPYGR
ncbi:transcription elongation factor SPT6 [Micractinium conductrix]|uniref:Transcription elongation factor SPT6 n=1 Tax=Micractinium conductrix TaxID=554055 RepID=A0A2P6V5J6_9CHLO|nr:transcription elongation factor SPT6 [Micractinium conductrix]|eukprot:PSC69358.1 transcription elongation factor SPT6 [Micractinium conductrix]